MTTPTFDKKTHLIKMSQRASEKCRQTAVERFWSKVKKTDDITQCWMWHKDIKYPYPMVCFLWPPIGKKDVPAHRVAYILYHGTPPPKSHICHRCGNKKCCNPHHLYAGNAKTNQADSVRHGTFKLPEPRRGGDSTNSKVTLESVLLARRIHPFLRRHEKTVLAKLMGITRHHLRLLAIGESWKHVTEHG